MKLVNNLKTFFKKLNTSNDDFIHMQQKSNRYDNMIRCVNIDVNADYVNLTGKHGVVLQRLKCATECNIDVDVIGMLNAGGVSFDKDIIRLNIIPTEETRK